MRKQCSSCGGFCGNTCKRENVAQPEQEPVIKINLYELVRSAFHAGIKNDFQTLDLCEKQVEQFINTTPPQRTWVGLTESEKISLKYAKDGMTLDYEDYAEAIEAKLRENNT